MPEDTSELPRPVVTLGETMGLFYSQAPGALAQATAMNLSIGGAESNVAIALSRLGARSRWIGRIGDDSVGERVRRELLAEGVDARTIIDHSAPTGLMIKERRTAESARVWYYRRNSAGSRLCVDDIDPDVIQTAALLHITGITAGLSPSALEAVLFAVRIATDASVPISFDINHRSGVWNDRNPADTYRALAAYASIVFGGVEEAEILTGSRGTAEQTARRIADLGPSEVVMKLGASGCLVVAQGMTHTHDAVPINAIDTVGAGDAFVGGYLAEHLLGHSVAEKMALAVTAGAFACLTPGDWESLPRRNDLILLTANEPVTR